MRLLRWPWFISYMLWQIVRNTGRDVASTFKHHTKLHPAIVEIPLRCRSDVEITLFSWAITIPPGSVALAVAAGDSTRPPSMFVHSLYAEDKRETLEELRRLESRLLRTVRKEFTE